MAGAHPDRCRGRGRGRPSASTRAARTDHLPSLTYNPRSERLVQIGHSAGGGVRERRGGDARPGRAHCVGTSGRAATQRRRVARPRGQPPRRAGRRDSRVGRRADGDR